MTRPDPFTLEQPQRLARAGLILLAVVVLVLLWWLSRRPDPPPPPGPGPGPELRVATFNIRNYPESPRQRDAALETLASLHAPIVALQEITDPDLFDAQVERVLGDHWATVFAVLPERRPSPPPAGHAAPLPPGRQNLGVLYDARRFELRSARVHPLVRYSGKPALEVHLRERARPRAPGLRIFTVHLKAFDEGYEQRLAQLEALQPVVARAVDSGERVVVLGDFNSTRPEDRLALADFAADTDTVWASEPVRCTEYWEPEGDDQCQASPLDHVFTWQMPERVEALGPCRELDCAPDRCPVFYHDVSDHCPLVVDW